jgi:hypothetical protein
VEDKSVFHVTKSASHHVYVQQPRQQKLLVHLFSCRDRGGGTTSRLAALQRPGSNARCLNAQQELVVSREQDYRMSIESLTLLGDMKQSMNVKTSKTPEMEGNPPG